MRSAEKEHDATCLHDYGKLPLTCNATITLIANFYNTQILWFRLKATQSFPTSGTTQPQTLHHIPEALNPQEQFCENLKSLSSNFYPVLFKPMELSLHSLMLRWFRPSRKTPSEYETVFKVSLYS